MYQPNSLLVKCYQASPIFIQNIFFSLAGLSNFYQRYNRHFFEHLHFLKRSEWWTSQQIESYQEERLRFIVDRAYKGSEFVRTQFSHAGVSPTDIKTIADLKKLPLSNKDQLRDSGKNYSNKLISKANLIQGLTSGTSGRALVTYHTKSTLAFQWAIWARHKSRFGIRLGDKHLTFGARVPIDARQKKPPFWRWNYFGKQMYLSTFHLSQEFLPDIVKFMNDNSFDYFVGYPSSMYLVAKFLEETKQRLISRPKYVVCGSDALYSHFEKTIREQFGVAVTEQYGMAEACGNFSKCEAGKFHLDFEFGIAELVDIPGMEKANRKKLVFTSLINEAMPLFRYDIGDIVEVDPQPCSCGRQSLTVKSIEGRIEDYITTPDGRRVSGINQVFEWANGIKEIQVYQASKELIEVRYVPSISFSKSDISSLEIEFRKRLGNDIAINYVQRDSIARSTMGKYKAVVSDVR